MIGVLRLTTFDLSLSTGCEVIQEHLGQSGWQALMACWHEAAGIKQPTQQ